MIENINEPWNEHLFEEVETFIKDELNKKYDKACNETEGNIPVFGPDGTLVDSRTNTNNFIKTYGGGVADWSETDDRKAGFIKNKPDLKTVAISGNYSDLSGKPELKPVATSGNYDDLTNTPSLSPVATSGNYNDLVNKPESLSEFTNDVGFLTEASLNTFATKSEVAVQLSRKQDTLVSGNNIKTVNGHTILGNGNIDIPRGNDGLDAINPFKGWFDDSTSLGTEYPDPSVGDYAYVKDEAPLTTISIWECTIEGEWSDSGADFNPSNNQSFKSGENLNEVRIIRSFDGNTVFDADDVLSAEVGRDVSVKTMNSDAIERKVTITNEIIGEDRYALSVYHGSNPPGVYPTGESAVPTNVVKIKLGDYSDNPSYVRFNGRGSSNPPYNLDRLGCFFSDADGKILKTFTFDDDETKEYLLKVPKNAEYFWTTSRYGDESFPQENFYCYVIDGIPFSEPGKYDNDLIPCDLSENSLSKAIAKLEGLGNIEITPLNYSINETNAGFWDAENNREYQITSGGSYSTCMSYINVTGFEKVMFLGRVFNGETSHGYAFLNDGHTNPVSTVFDVDENLTENGLKIYFANVPQGKTWLATEVGLFNKSEYSFFCYGINGDTVTDIVKKNIENSELKENVDKLNNDIYGSETPSVELLNEATPLRTYEGYKYDGANYYRIGTTGNNVNWYGGTSVAEWVMVKVIPGKKVYFTINGDNVSYIAILKKLPEIGERLAGKKPYYYTKNGDKFYGRFKVTDDGVADEPGANYFTLPEEPGEENMYLYMVKKNGDGETTVDYFLELDEGTVGLEKTVNGIEARVSQIEYDFFKHGTEKDIVLEKNAFITDEDGSHEELLQTTSNEYEGNIGISTGKTWAGGMLISWQIYKVTPGTYVHYKIDENDPKTGYMAILYDISDIGRGNSIHFYGGSYTEGDNTLDFSSRFRVTETIDGPSKFESNSFKLPDAVDGKPDMYLYIATSGSSSSYSTVYSGTYYSYENGVYEKVDDLTREVIELEEKVGGNYSKDTYFNSEITELESVDSIGNTLKPLKYDMYALCNIPDNATIKNPSSGDANGLYLYNDILYRWENGERTVSRSTLYCNGNSVYYWDGNENSVIVDLLDKLQDHFFKVITNTRPFEGSPSALYYYDGNVHYWDGETSLIVEDAVLTYHDELQSVQHKNTSNKAKAYSYVRWIPNGYIPVQIGQDTSSQRILRKNYEQFGIPYSSTKEISKYVGLSVTMHTFMTAVNNPYSLIYTENLNKTANDSNKLFPSGYAYYSSLPDNLKNKPSSAWGNKYNGKTNTATYFGCVCSEFTAICSGRKMDYGTSTADWMHERAHKFSKIYTPPLKNGEYDFKEVFKVGDVLYNLKKGNVDAGHCRLLADIERTPDGSSVTKIWIAESTGFRNQTTSSEQYPYTTNSSVSDVKVFRSVDLYKNLESDGTLMGYTDYSKFIDVSKIDRFFKWMGETDKYGPVYNQIIKNANLNTFSYNNDICTFAGDKASFSTKEEYNEQGEVVGYNGDLIVINYNLTNDSSFYTKYDHIVVKKLGEDGDASSITKEYYFPQLGHFYDNAGRGNTYTDGFPDGFNSTLPNELPNQWRDEMEDHFLYLDKHLEPGKYEVWAANQVNASEKTMFEILNTTFSISRVSNGENLLSVKWDTEKSPNALYVRIVDSMGSGVCGRELTPNEIRSGLIVSNFKKLSEEQLPEEDGDKWENSKFMKVFFLGEYGQAFGSENFTDFID